MVLPLREKKIVFELNLCKNYITFNFKRMLRGKMVVNTFVVSNVFFFDNNNDDECCIIFIIKKVIFRYKMRVLNSYISSSGSILSFRYKLNATFFFFLS